LSKGVQSLKSTGRGKQGERIARQCVQAQNYQER